MKKLFAVVLTVTMLLTVCPLSVFAATAGTVVYQEDFQSGKTDIVAWNDDPSQVGHVSIATEGSNKFLKCVTSTGDGANGYTATAPFGTSLKDFDLECSVRPDNIKNPDYNWMKIAFHADKKQGENESYIFEIWGWRGAMSIKSTAHRQSETTKKAENQDFTFDNGVWHKVKIEGRGNTYTVYVDDKKCVSMTDASSFFKEGYFTFASWGVNFSVDNIKVTSYDAGAVAQTTSKGQTTSKPSASSTPAVGSSQTTSGSEQVSSSTDTTAAAGEVTTEDTSGSTQVSGTDTSDSVAQVDKKGNGGSAWLIICIVLGIVLVGGIVTVFVVMPRVKKKGV